MLRILFIFFATLFYTSDATSQTIYLKYDQDCMDRLEYASATESAAYVSYRFDLGDGKIVHFDVGKENIKWVRDLPGKVVQCEALNFDKESIRKLNAGAGKVFMIRESPTHYNVSEVKKAVYIDDYKSGVEVIMKDAEFVLDMSKLISNQNISKPSSKMAVFLDGTINYQCVKGYIVKKMENFNSDSFKEYILIPELGIVEKRSVSKQGSMVSGRVKLDRIDEFSFSETLVNICDGIQASYYDANPLESQGAEASAVSENPPAVSTSETETEIPESYQQNSPCGQGAKGYHYVSKGETLYSISRRYGVTVDQVKSWNGLKGNTIKVCQRLKVGTTTTTTDKGSSSIGKPAIEGEDGQGHWVRNSDVHITRPGESVAALANMYGYTEERFRKMNNLAPYERIYAGQELHTSDCAWPSGESTTTGQPMPYEEPVEVVESLTEKGNPDVFFRPVKVHQVRKSETLFSIAKLYDTTVDRVKELNGLGKNVKLATGQRLYVQ